jgi:sugar lactone lactonase YvrE
MITEGMEKLTRVSSPVLMPDGKTIVFCGYDDPRIWSLDLDTRRATVVAGTGEKGFADGLAGEAKFNVPCAIWMVWQAKQNSMFLAPFATTRSAISTSQSWADTAFVVLMARQEW